MCLAICYTFKGQIFITHFTDIRAKMPLVSQSNPEHFLPWGRRLDEPGELPFGSSLSLEKKEQGLYDQYFPKPVRIHASKFMEQDCESQCRWFEVTPGQYLQGLLLRDGHEQRIYVATFIPQATNTPFLRWPLIMADHHQRT